MRSVHYNLWLRHIILQAGSGNSIVVAGELRFVEAWMIALGNVQVVYPGDTGISRGFIPNQIILDESIDFQNYSNRIWWSTVIHPQIQGLNVRVVSWHP